MITPRQPVHNNQHTAAWCNSHSPALIKPHILPSQADHHHRRGGSGKWTNTLPPAALAPLDTCLDGFHARRHRYNQPTLRLVMPKTTCACGCLCSRFYFVEGGFAGESEGVDFWKAPRRPRQSESRSCRADVYYIGVTRGERWLCDVWLRKTCLFLRPLVEYDFWGVLRLFQRWFSENYFRAIFFIAPLHLLDWCTVICARVGSVE